MITFAFSLLILLSVLGMVASAFLTCLSIALGEKVRTALFCLLFAGSVAGFFHASTGLERAYDENGMATQRP